MMAKLSQKMLLVFSSIFVSIWASTTGNIAGFVRDRLTKEPLIGANVVILGTALGAATDERGYYHIDNIPVGQYSIGASYIGYQELIKTKVSILSRRTIYLDFELTPMPIEIEGVIVRPDYFPKERYQATSNTELNFHEIRTDPEGYNLPRMLSSLPGVATAEDYASTIIVRGGSPDENLTILDNIEIDYPAHFPKIGSGEGAMSIVNTNLVRDVTFSTGGFSTRYGNRLSSFLNIELRDGNREHFEASCDLSMAGLELTVEGPITKKANHILSYRKSFLEILDKLVDIGDIIPYCDDYCARVVFEPNVKNRLSLLNIGAIGRLVVPKWSPNFNYDLKINSWMNIVGLNWQYLLGDISFLQTTLSRNYLRQKLDALTEFQYLPKEERYLLSTEMNLRPKSNITIETGGQIGFWFLQESVFVAPYRFPTGESVPGINIFGDTATYRAGIYMQLRYQPFKFLQIMPGLRYDYLHLNQKSVYSPRLSLSLPIFPFTTLNFAYGHFYQAPSYFTLMKEPELKFKRAIHYIVGIEQLITPSLRFTIEGYYKDLAYLPVPATNEPNAELDSTGSGNAKGIELFLHQKLVNKIYGRISYSYGFSYRYDWRGTYSADWDKRHILTIIGGYQLMKNMDLSIKFRYASGRPYTPFDTLAKFQDQVSGNWYCPMSDKLNSANYPAYHRLDIQWSGTNHFGPITITSYISIQNIYNRYNVYDYYWDVKEGKIKSYNQFSRMIVGGFHIAF